MRPWACRAWDNGWLSAFPRPSGRGSIAAFAGCSVGFRGVVLPPAIRPGLHCGVLERLQSTRYSTTSPGHQAGAPLRRPDRERRRRWRDLLPPAIRPGLHCGDWLRPAPPQCDQDFPRPSGRGSIAATPPAGRSTSSGPLLPPAIRPGLHCGAVRSWRRGAVLRDLPPAIRPGLHCGYERNLDIGGKLVDFPRPSGRGSIAASAAVRSSISACIFPRPSGRGSIAAHTAALPSTEAGRPSPGHQAGAPLRLAGLERLHVQGEPLPPAIRPGLHCGGGMNETTETQWASSPGHQAGAPLRHAATRR